MNAALDLRHQILRALAHEHLLRQRMEEERALAERWGQRVDLAGRTGNHDLAEQARGRQQQALRRAEMYEQGYRRQALAVAELASRATHAPGAPSSQELVRSLDRLAHEDRLDRELAELKASLAAN